MDDQILNYYFNHLFEFNRMKKIQSVIAIFILICCCSCEKDSNIKLPKVEEKLVINCAISPQDGGVAVYVSLSQPIFNTSTSNEPYPSITNATVIISSNAGKWTLPYDSFNKAYMIDTTLIQIKAGTTYALSVSTPEGRFVKAQTTIPYQNNTLTCTSTPDLKTTNRVIIHGSWSDPANSADYYEFIVGGKYLNNPNNYGWSILTDEENPGGILKKELDVEYNAMFNDTLHAGVYTLSPELYKYYDRIDKIKNSGGPFSEPIPMYSNIEGGFGIFGSFNKYIIKVLP
jgi:hypothetical protein